MKNLVSIILFTLFISAVNAQVDATLFYTTPYGITCLKVKDDKIYVGQSEFFTGHIGTLSLTQPNSFLDLIISDVDVTTMDFVGDDLYYYGNGKLGMADVTLPTPVPTTIYNYPTDENLYVQRIVSDGEKLFALESKIDTNGMTVGTQISAITVAPTVSRTVFYSTTDVLANMDFADGKLYLNNDTQQQIQKISTTSGANPVAEVAVAEENFYRGIKVSGNNLYTNGTDVVYQYDLSQPDLESISLTTEMPIWPYWMELHGTTLYLAEYQNYKDIYKIDLGTVSTNNTVAEDLQLTLAPNPSHDFIAINGLKTPARYQIVAINGALVQSGILENNQKINIIKLDSGPYLLALENGAVIKFIKN